MEAGNGGDPGLGGVDVLCWLTTRGGRRGKSSVGVRRGGGRRRRRPCRAGCRSRRGGRPLGEDALGAVGADGQRGRGADPGDGQLGLALQEALRADAAGRAALGRELGEVAHLAAAGVGAGEGLVADRDGDDDRLLALGGLHRAEEHHAGIGGQVDAGHAAGRPTLRAHRAGGEPEELGVAGDEHELGVVRRLHGSDDRVAGLQRDDLELRLVGPVAGRHPLDHTLPRAERDRARGVQRDEREHALLAVGQREVVAHLHARAELHRVERGGREVDRREPDEPSAVGDGADLAAARGVEPGQDRVVLAAPGRRLDAVEAVALSGARVDAQDAAGGRQVDAARYVGDLELHRHRLAARARAGDGRLRLGEERPSRGAELHGDLLQLVGHESLDACRAAEDLLQFGDLGRQLVALGLQLDAGELGEPAEPQLQDVVGLQRAEVEHLLQPRARLVGVVGGADDLDDLVDVEDRDEEALDQVQALLAAREPELRAARDDADAVVEVDLQQLAQAQGLRAARDEGDVVDREALLQRRVPVELLEHGVRAEPGLDADDEAEAVLPVGEVGHVGDAVQLLRVDAVLDLLDHTLRADPVGELGHDEAALARGDRLDAHLGAHPEAAAARRVRVADAGQARDGAAAREVGAGDVVHQLVQRRVGVGQEVAGGADDLHQVVRGHVGGHADRDAAGAVDQEIRERGGQHVRLQELVVVVGDEVHDILVEVFGEGQRGGGEARLRVARGGGAVVQRAEVAVPVDQWDAQGEVLGHAHERVVDRAVAVRVQLSHHLAGDARRLDVTAVRAQAHLGHHVEDAPLHGLQAVAGVRERPRVDDGVRVLEERALHLGRDVDVFDAFGDRGLVVCWCHSCIR